MPTTKRRSSRKGRKATGKTLLDRKKWRAKVTRINEVDAKLGAAIRALQSAQRALRGVTAKPPGGGPNVTT